MMPAVTPFPVDVNVSVDPDVLRDVFFEDDIEINVGRLNGETVQSYGTFGYDSGSNEVRLQALKDGAATAPDLVFRVGDDGAPVEAGRFVAADNGLHLGVSGTTTGYIESEDGVTAAVSGGATGRIRYNDTTATFQISVQGGTYDDIVVSGSAESPWTKTGAVIHPDTLTDEVSVGTASSFGKFTVVGDTVGQITTVIRQVVGQTARQFTLQDSGGANRFVIQPADVAGVPWMDWAPAARTSGNVIHDIQYFAPLGTGIDPLGLNTFWRLAHDTTVTFTTGAAAAFEGIRIAGGTTLAASAATQTFTTASSFYISDAPAAGANVAITNPYSVFVDAGDVRIDDNLVIGTSATNLGKVVIFADATGEITLRVREVAAQTQAAFVTENVTGSDIFTVQASTVDGILVDVTPAVRTGDSNWGILRLIAAAHTAMTPSSLQDVNFDFSNTLQFTTGAAASQVDGLLVQPRTYSATAATQTITNAASVRITGAPVAGANVAITNPFALDVTGATRVTGKLTVTGSLDPTDILLSGGGTAHFYESNDGSTAGVSGGATGRIRYNDGTATWQVSIQAGAYEDIMTASTMVWQTTAGVANLLTSTDTVTVGSAVALAKLAVDGDADEIQFLVQANATQTANIFVVEDSAGTNIFAVDSVAALLVGSFTGTPAAAANFTWNSASVDSDFIVNSDSSAAATPSLFVDGEGVGPVGFGTNAPRSYLSVTFTTAERTVQIAGANARLAIAGTGQAGLFLADTTATADQRMAVLFTDAGTLFLRSTTDALALSQSFFTMDHSDGRITVGAATNLAGRFAIDGQADEIQLLVQGHSTQTANLFVVENSAAADLLVLTGTGAFTLSPAAANNFTWNSGSVDSDAIFNADSSVAATPALFVDGEGVGQIGIGTNDPRSYLSVTFTTAERTVQVAGANARVVLAGSGQAGYFLADTTATADQRMAVLFTDAGTLFLRSTTDALVLSQSFFTMDHSDGRITVGAAANLAGRFAIDGQADEIQLLVQGHSTQTSDLFVIENSAGTDIFQVSLTAVTVTGSLSATTSISAASSSVVLDTNGITMGDAKDIITNATTGTVIATATSQKLAFWAATPVVQQAHIADPSGGATVDAEARTAIDAINAVLAATGLTAAA